ncbi:MAG: T9SS type A sorting domain-containing protein [Burkholderiales bacterium]|nr:T9SS type A sorting domain-containing protein [Bacteroidia bacterium]
MKKAFFLTFYLLVFAKMFTQNLQWATQLNTQGVFYSNSQASVTDSIGNIYTISNNQGFITKVDSSGNIIWNKNVVTTSGTGNVNGISIALDKLGNIYATGSFAGIADFNPGIGTYTLSSQSVSNLDIYVMKLNNFGYFIWAKKLGGGVIGGTTSIHNQGYAIHIDYNANILVSGYFSGTVDFDASPGSYTMTSFGGNDIFVSKLDSSGNFIWAKQFGGTANDGGAYDISTDAFGNVYTVGIYASSIADFDPGVGTYTLSTIGNNSAFISKLDINGDFIFAKKIGGMNGYNGANSIELDNMGNILLTGFFAGNVDFDVGAGTYTVTSAGSSDAFVLKLTNAGNYIWVKTFKSSIESQGFSLTIDGYKNIYTTGIFEGNVDFDPNSGIYNLSAQGVDAFVNALDSLGNFLWSQKIGGNTNNGEQGNSISHDYKNNIFVTGLFSSVVDFDSGIGTYSITPIAFNSVFISKLSPCPTSAYAISGYTSVCSGATTAYSVLPATGATGYIWSTPLNSVINSGTSTNSINLTYSTTPGMIIVTPTNSCGSGPSSSLTIIFNGPLGITPTSATVCSGSSLTFTASGAATYSWSTGVLTSTMNTIPSSSSVYTVNGTTTIGCIGTQTTVVSIDNTCTDVWPGDVNNDGTADNLDVLEFGLHFGQMGPVRTFQMNLWYALTANNWTGTTTNGKNLAHSDCNGDGIINIADTFAIYNNYGLTHAFKTAQTTTVNPQLSIVPDQSSVLKGTWGTASIYLGDATTSISNINGVAYTIDFDKTLIETNNIYLEYQTSFLDASYQNLHFRKLNLTLGKLYTATTHTITNNVSGYGKIATLHYKIKSTITTDQVLNFGISQANQSDASGAIVPLTSGTGTLMAMGTSVGLQELNGNSVSISPNPTNGSLTINSKIELQKIEVVSITGQILLSEMPTSVSHTLHLENFANGIYFVNVYQNDRIVKREKIVLNK